MDTSQRHPQRMRRRTLLHAGLATSLAAAVGRLTRPAALWGREAGPPRRGLRTAYHAFGTEYNNFGRGSG
jgi:hypothetical protein